MGVATSEADLLPYFLFYIPYLLLIKKRKPFSFRFNLYKHPLRNIFKQYLSGNPSSIF